MQNNFSKISIIILNWNGLNDTAECLESVRKIDYPNFEVIVVDNGSSDDSPDQVKRLFPEVTLICNGENLGFAGGSNVGIRHAMKNGAQYIWLLNNDTVVEPDVLSKLVRTAENDPCIGLLSPTIYYYSEPYKIQYSGAWFDYNNYAIEYLSNIDDSSFIDERDICLWGTALFIRREVIDKIGLLNEKYFAYYEDVDYSLRTLRAGYVNRVELSAKVFHKFHYKRQGEIKNLPPHYFYYMARNEYKFWGSNVNGFKKILFLKKYLAKRMKKIGYFKEYAYDKELNASLDGLYSAFCNASGEWNKDAKMPSIMKKIILFRPYLWANMMEGNINNIFINIYKRAITKSI